MKKNIFTLFILLLGFSQLASAMPAKPGKFVKIQPDGSTITLERHGDEFLHWTTTEDGLVVAPDVKGFYKPAEKPTRERLGGRAQAEKDAAEIRARRLLSGPRTATVSHPRFPVVLVQFSDVQFSVSNPQTAFSNLLNQVGYSENGGTGSVHDYYLENSMNTFDATFDVIGPYTYNGTCSANAEEEDAAKILWAAIKAYDSTVNWAQYDNDGDGKVDMVFMYYAGYNEAEGADNTIWPHKYNFSSAGTTTSTLDGKTFDIYACTSELKGTSGTNMCGIGTCAHEFSHTQGIPDFYDVNYDNYGDGEAGATYSYDIMCSGGYNNAGRTPPYFTAEERIMMGWMDGYTTMPASGEIVIPPLNTNFAYKMATSNTTGSGEYFVFECRSGQGWDAYVEPGLVVYHADKSTKYNVTFKTSSTRSYTYTPYRLWTEAQQYINASGSHPCFYIVPAADQSNLNYGNDNKLPFPGEGGVSYYCPTDWDGNTYDLFSDISFRSNGSAYGYSSPVVTMTRGQNYKGVCGYITNSSGAPIEGAKVSIYAAGNSSKIIISPGPNPDISRISGRIPGNLQMSAYTDENGYYSFDLSSLSQTSLDIEVVAQGYITKYKGFEVADELITKSFTMRGIHEPIDYTLRKFDLSAGGVYGLGAGNTYTNYLSICLSAEDLEDFVGRKILELGFAYSLEDGYDVSSVYGIIDFGDTRKMTERVSSPAANAWNALDVSSKNLYVPAGQDCHFGFGLVKCTDPYPMLFSDNNPKDGGFCYALSSSTSISNSAISWSTLDYGNLLIYVVLDDSSEVDYNYIENPGYGTYAAGYSFPLKLIEAAGSRKPGSAISWYFDDKLVATSSSADSGLSVSLKYPGNHLIEARFTTSDGKTKIIELEVNVTL